MTENFGNISIQPSHNGWMYLWWRNSGTKKKLAVQSLRRAEQVIKEKGFTGWITSSDLGHTTMHTILKKLGAMEYLSNDKFKFFQKVVV